MDQELKFKDIEFIENIQSSSEPNWMKEERINSYKLFSSLPSIKLKYGISISLDTSQINFEEIKIIEKKQIKLPKYKNVIIENLSDALINHEEIIKKYIFSSFDKNLSKFEALHKMFWNKGLFVYIPKNTKVNEPIILEDLSDNFEFQHNLIILEENSSAVILEEEKSNNENKAYKTKVTEIFLNNHSALDYINSQNLSQNTILFSSKRASLSNDSIINWFDFCLGGKITKSEIITKLNSPGSTTNIYSLFSSDNTQQFDLSSSVFHNSKYTNSDMLTKGILYGRSKIIYNGLIKIEENASNSNGYQKQEALLLSPLAEINPIPSLEIDNNNIKCKHSTSVSQIDKDKLFYLISRGISEEQSTKLIVNGFLDQIIRKVKIKEIRKRIRKIILK